MLIVCPNCATSYDVEMASLRPNGRQVRCVRCRTVWHAEPSHADKLIAAVEELAPVRWAVEAVAEVAAGTLDPAPEPLAEPGDAQAGEAPDHPVEAPVLEAPAESPSSDMAESADAAAEPGETAEVESPSIAPDGLDVDQAPAEVTDEETAAASAELVEDVESFAARRFVRRAKRKSLQWPLSNLQSAILAMIIIDAIIVGWRTDFVWAMPQTASFYAAIGMPVNLRGLDFDSLATSAEQHDGVPILVVAGNIANDTSKTADVPHVRFSVRNAARQEIYSWTAVASRTMLPPGEAVAFRTRLASPPPDAHDVLIRFVNRYDIMTGTR
jgi:predicted Zn finger-like uncharacterized protein